MPYEENDDEDICSPDKFVYHGDNAFYLYCSYWKDDFFDFETLPFDLLLLLCVIEWVSPFALFVYTRLDFCALMLFSYYWFAVLLVLFTSLPIFFFFLLTFFVFFVKLSFFSYALALLRSKRTLWTCAFIFFLPTDEFGSNVGGVGVNVYENGRPPCITASLCKIFLASSLDRRLLLNDYRFCSFRNVYCGYCCCCCCTFSPPPPDPRNCWRSLRRSCLSYAMALFNWSAIQERESL